MIPYPFRTKTPPKGAMVHEILHDDGKPPKLQRPSFSNERGCWIFDFIFNLGTDGDIWLFMMNMNTRYLVAYYCPTGKNAREVGKALNKLFDILVPMKQPITCVMGDGEKAFSSHELRNMFDVIDGKKIWNNSPFTYHGKILDRAVRTIRDAIGYRKMSQNQVQQVIEYYNRTYHKSIDCSPYLMMVNPEWEWQYIRYCQDKLIHIRSLQRENGLLTYQPNNILLIHLELTKTSQKFEKQRRFWNRVAVFKEYTGGNVKVRTHNGKEAVVPTYFTKFVANNVSELKPLIVNTYSLTQAMLRNLR
jgi:hypothetical protein